MIENRKDEEIRIDHVLAVIESKAAQLTDASDEIKEKVVDFRKHFWDEVKVNVETFDDMVETIYEIRQQSEVLAERERAHQQHSKQRKVLEKLKHSPYFARIDFAEAGIKEASSIYIGVASLLNEAEDAYLVYDWRAPISSMYYDHTPGPAQYEAQKAINQGEVNWKMYYDHTPGPIQTEARDSMIHGEMTLKRQFIIKNGTLQAMFDTGVAIGDDLLKEVLGSVADNKMKSIVATIQKEQNQIIRNHRARILIVEGVAGSGKTSVAMQRIAFLLYQGRKHLTADNIMLFSPNALFSSYISSVLPDLGEDNVKQMTFQEYAEKRLGKRFDLESPFEQMEYVLTAQQSEMYTARFSGIRYKARNEFKELIAAYMKHLSKQDLIFKSIRFRGELLVSAEQIARYFYQLPKDKSIPERMQETMEWLLAGISVRERHELDSDWVIEEAELLDNDSYTDVYNELQSENRFSENTFDDFKREQRKIAQRIVKKAFKPIRVAIKRLRFIHTTAIYLQLFKKETAFIDTVHPVYPIEWDLICDDTVRQIRRGVLTHEDTAPYLYLEDQLEGQRINSAIHHVLIDEAQDYSPFQFYVLKQLFPSARMTILGDLNQAIYAHSVGAPSLLTNDLFQGDHVEKLKLAKSYRSTREIVDFTRYLVDNGELIEAFNRSESKPSLTIVESDEALYAEVSAKIKQLTAKNYETVAVICKSAQACKAAYEQISEVMPVQLMVDESKNYRKGIIVIPAYLAKGIEFDAVIIYDASHKTYAESFERNLFYTACTRAMHELHLFSVGEKTRFMDAIPGEIYTVN